MAEADPYRHVTSSIKDAIPETCVNCPALLGSLSVHNEFVDDAINRRKKTWNPITKAGMYIAQKLSERRLNNDAREQILTMQDCAGTIAYPANSADPAILCGIGVRKAVSEQVTTQQSLRTR